MEIARLAVLNCEMGGHGIDQSKLSLPWWAEQIILACMHACMLAYLDRSWAVSGDVRESTVFRNSRMIDEWIQSWNHITTSFDRKNRNRKEAMHNAHCAGLRTGDHYSTAVR